MRRHVAADDPLNCPLPPPFVIPTMMEVSPTDTFHPSRMMTTSPQCLLPQFLPEAPAAVRCAIPSVMITVAGCVGLPPPLSANPKASKLLAWRVLWTVTYAPQHHVLSCFTNMVGSLRVQSWRDTGIFGKVLKLDALLDKVGQVFAQQKSPKRVSPEWCFGCHNLVQLDSMEFDSTEACCHWWAYYTAFDTSVMYPVILSEMWVQASGGVGTFLRGAQYKTTWPSVSKLSVEEGKEEVLVPLAGH